MLRYMRTHAASWGIKVILGLVIVVFVFWGVGRIESKRKTVVAQVGKRYITIGEFDRAYREALEFYRGLLGEALTPERLKEMRVGKEVLSRLIRLSLLLEEAQRWGLRTSAEELRELIVASPLFQRHGRFDRDLYLSYLRRKGTTPAEFEERLRREVLVGRLQRALTAGVLFPPQDADVVLKGLKERVELEFVVVPPEKLKGEVTLKEEDLLRYFSQHQEEFRIPEKVEIAYLRCSPLEALKEVKVTEEEIRAYYQRYIDAFRVPRQVKLRHIFLRVEEGEEEQVKKRAQELLERLRKGEDFARLAKEFSEDPFTAKRGGELGFVSREGLDPEFARGVFSLGEGEMGIVRSSRGYHLVKVEGVKPERLRPLEEVRGEIEGRLRRRRAEELCAMRMADAAYKAKREGDLRGYAERAGLKVETPPPFARGEEIERLGTRPKLTEVAFSLQKGEISSWVEDGGDFFVLQCLGKVPPRMPAFEEVREKVRERLLEVKAQEAARDLAGEILRRWKVGEDVQQLLKEYGLSIKRVGPVPRAEVLLPGLSSAVREVALLVPQDPVLPAPLASPEGYVAVRLKDVFPPEEGTEEEREGFRLRLEGLWRQEVMEAWFRKRGEEVEVELNPVLLSPYGVEVSP